MGNHRIVIFSVFNAAVTHTFAEIHHIRDNVETLIYPAVDIGSRIIMTEIVAYRM